MTIVCLCLSFAVFGQSSVQVEPPFWWTGMANNSLQLMLSGPKVCDHIASVSSENVNLIGQHRLQSENYLFLDLEISPTAPAQMIDITLRGQNGSQISLTYELVERLNDPKKLKGFDASDVMYLITPDRFANGDTTNDEIAGLADGHDRTAEFGRHGGDIQGIIDHLDYIDELGFTAIWLNPVLENDQPEESYHGYATTDYYAVDPRFGTNVKYRELCEQARSKGIGVVMDIIVNHCGSGHPWLSDPPSSDWINYNDGEYVQTNHRKSTLIDPYVATADRERMVKGWFVPAMPDLNQANPFLATYLIQNSIWWIEYLQLAGIRQDTYSYPFRQFMTDWTCAIMDEYPNFSIVGEEWVENPSIISYWQRDKINHDGYTSCLGSLMDFPMTLALHKALTETEGWATGWQRLYENLANDFVYAHPEELVIFPDNHDMSRIYTRVNEDYDLFQMAISYILTMRGIPQLYYGTEIIMSNKGSDSHGIIRADFPGGWNDDDVNAFERVNLLPSQEKALDFLHNILTWRKETEVIHAGHLTHYVPMNGVYTYFRYDDEDLVMVVFNKNEDEVQIDLERFDDIMKGKRSCQAVLTGEEMVLENTLKIEGRGTLILDFEDTK